MAFTVYLNDEGSREVQYGDDDHYTVLQGGVLRVSGKGFGAKVYSPIAWNRVEVDPEPRAVPVGKQLAV